MTEQQMHDALYLVGEATMQDIRADIDDPLFGAADYGFECYVGVIPYQLQGIFDANLAGVIYAGDLGIWYYLPDGDGRLEMAALHSYADQIFPRVFGRGGIYGGES